MVREKIYVSKCPKCTQQVEWQEKDMIVKYAYGMKGIIHCPHCDKLITVWREEAT